jgi:hypothetical protein
MIFHRDLREGSAIPEMGKRQVKMRIDAACALECWEIALNRA